MWWCLAILFKRYITIPKIEIVNEWYFQFSWKIFRILADDEKVTVLWPDWDKIERVLFTFQQDSVDSVWSQLFENNVSWYYHVTIGYDVDWPITI